PPGIGLLPPDGPPAGPRLVLDVNPGAASSKPANFHQIGGTVWFTAELEKFKPSLFQTDGTPEGTFKIADVPTTIEPVVGGNYLYYFDRANTLWRTDGAAAGTVPL